MKTKRILGIFLALLLAIGAPVAALAAEYDIEVGDIAIWSGENPEGAAEQWVWQENNGEYQDAAPVITGSSETNWVEVEATEGATANVTLRDASFIGMDVYGEGSVNINVEGTNTLSNEDEIGTYIRGVSATVTGTGTLNVEGGYGGIGITGSDLTVDGPTVNASGAIFGIFSEPWIEGINYDDELGDYVYVYGDPVALTVNSGNVTGTATGEMNAMPMLRDSGPEEYVNPSCGILVAGDGSTLAVNGGTVVGIAQGDPSAEYYGGILLVDGATLSLGSGMVVLDANGNDITAAVLADPNALSGIGKVTITEEPNGIVYIKDEDAGVQIQLLGAYYGTTFEKSGEPDAAAMEKLSKGIDGECIYKVSLRFTDKLEKHGKFQLNFVMPQYAGQHVTVATLDAEGNQQTFDRWVGDDGVIAINVDHLGDFAIFLA